MEYKIKVTDLSRFFKRQEDCSAIVYGKDYTYKKINKILTSLGFEEVSTYHYRKATRFFDYVSVWVSPDGSPHFGGTQIYFGNIKQSPCRYTYGGGIGKEIPI